MSTIRAVLFDADGVLQHGGSEDLSSRLQRALGFVPDPLDDFICVVLEAERQALVGQAELVEVLEPIVLDWGAPGAAQALAEAWWCCIEPDPDVLALIRVLRRGGLFCALASNQQRFRASYMCNSLAYDAVFDRCFYSYQLGYAKPDPRYFRAILAGLPFEPGEILFIDDLKENVASARSVGLHAEQFVHSRRPDAVNELRALLGTYSVVVPEPG